ncbi:MAG: response regulator [Candidatus Margulisiibacteriota bacterium]
MRKPLLLIVEGVQRELDRLFDVLSKHYEVMTASTGQMAASVFAQYHLKIRIVLIGTGFPDTDSLTLLTRLREISVLPELIMLSDSGDISSAVNAIKLGAYDYLAKPYKESALLLIIERTLENHEIIKKFEEFSKKLPGDAREFDRRLIVSQSLIAERRSAGHHVSAEEILSILSPEATAESPNIDAIRSEIQGVLDCEKAKILVVEDEDVYRSMIVGFIENRYGFFASGTGSGALSLLKENPDIDIVLLDIFLPDINGVDLLPLIKSACPGVDVIVITSYESVDIAVETMRKGASDYLNKPFLKMDILSTISKTLQRKQLQKVLPALSKRVMAETVSDRSKLDLLLTACQTKKRSGRAIIMGDVYHYFPELRDTFMPDAVVLPEAIVNGDLGVFIEELRQKMSKFSAS